QYFPKHRWGHVSASHPSSDPDEGRTFPMLDTFVHPLILELLDPMDQWDDAAVVVPRFELIERTTWLDRPALRVSIRVEDWAMVSMVSETVWEADENELIVDAETGVVLRAASLLDGRAFRIVEVFDVSFDQPIDPSLFVLHPPPGTTFGDPPPRMLGRSCCTDRA